MTSIFFLWPGGTAPSPYTKTSAFNGYYPKCTSTVGNHGVTGGSTNHSNTPTLTSEGQSTTNHCYHGSGSTATNPHNNHATSGLSCSTVNNDPPYYTYELIYMDLTSWENNVRCLPSGAIVLSTSSLAAWDEVTRYGSGDNKLVKFGAAGSSGGTATRSHTVQCALASITNGLAVEYSGSSAVLNSYPHSHGTASGTSSAVSTLPKRVVTRFYEALSQTTQALSGMVAFVDGTPSGNWDALTSWNGSYLMSADSNATVTGSNTHTHPDVLITSPAPDNWNSQRSNYVNLGVDVYVADLLHTHALTISLGTANHEPLNVQLYPVQLNTTLTVSSRSWGGTW